MKAVSRLMGIFFFVIVFNELCDAQERNGVTNIKQFGAKGDGSSDDYNAFISAAEFMNKQGGGTLFIPKGTYRINTYHTKDNAIPDVVFKNCNNLKITGENSIISVKGDFHRTADFTKGRFKYSKVMAIMPISLSNCKNVEISDLEINGNVDKMTRDTLVAESFGFLIKITECENVSIVNVKLHHAQSDGIYVNGKMHPTINLKMSNVISSNNGRQGLSIINLNRGEFINCCFINTGFTEGKYGLHSPASGVDIESNLTKDSVRTGNLVFDNCTFKNNKGGQFFCTSPKTTRNVTVKNSTFDAVNSPAPYQIILNAENVVLDNCKIDCRIGNIWPTWKVAPGSKVRISNCEIKSSRNGILSASDNPRDSVVIDNNTFIFTGDASFKSYFLYLQTTNLQFTNNKIYMPAEFIQSKAATSLIQNARVSSGNKFYSGTNLIKSKASYRNTKIVKD